MRILGDEKEATPISFKERINSRPSLDVRVLEALDKMFIKRSFELNIPLASLS